MNFLFSYTCKLIRKDRNKVDILFFRIQVLIQYYFLSVTSIKICPRARWSTTAKTVAGTGIEGSSANQLSWPVGIFIHKEKNTLYVADSENNRVQMFKLNESSITGNTVASSVQTPVSVYVDDDGGELVIYIALQGSNRLEKWVQGASSGIQVGDECRSCAGVWLDKEKNVYMAEASRSRVVKWSPSTQETTVVAGQTDKSGTTDDLLNIVQGIYVHQTDGTVYVADKFNNRIQKWSRNAEKGITVAGWSNSTAGKDAASLSDPFDVWVDEETDVIYVADTANSRIQRWSSKTTEGDTIVGGFGMIISLN
jgi:sugar lactone lactonase YvrE